MRNRGPPAGTGDATKELKEAHEKEKTEKIERMKQGTAENMTIAVLKQLGLKDKGTTFSSKTKKSELVQIFRTQAGYVTAYDECFPKSKQFYVSVKSKLQHPPPRAYPGHLTSFSAREEGI